MNNYSLDGGRAEEKYRNDNTFRHVVDMLQALLGQYQITPSELREAVILAATMHEMYRIKPMFIANYPAMFGGEPAKADTVDMSKVEKMITTYGGHPNRRKTKGDRRSKDNAVGVGRLGKFERHQERYKATNRSTNGDRRVAVPAAPKAAPFTEHVYGSIRGDSRNPYRVCVRCRMSDTYINRFGVKICK